ncbi:MAG: hypothetical protein Q7S98_03630 [Deltaproteobacteria bacterium]|nr:hypothetical protein [Deltaproteobacteria bacterium]
MTCHLSKKLIGFMVLSLILSACSGGGDHSFFGGSKKPKQKTKSELWLVAEEYCLDADNNPIPERFQDGHLCLASPQNNEQTSANSIQIAGMLQPFGAGLTGVNIYAEKADNSCQDPRDQSAGCTQTILDTVRDIDSQGAFASSALLPLPGVYTIRIIASFVSDSGEEQDVILERTVVRQGVPRISFVPTALGRRSDQPELPDQTVTLCDRGENQYEVSFGNCDEESDATQRMRSNRIEFCVNVDDDTPTPAAVITATVKNDYTAFNQTVSYYQSAEESLGSCGTNGRLIKLPLGHGLNEITVTASNEVTRSDSSRTPLLTIQSFDNDLKGPDLCIAYLDQNGQFIGNSNGKVIQRSTSDIIVDVALEKCPGGSTSTSFTLAPNTCLAETENDPDNCSGVPGSVCLQKGNKPKTTQLCPTGGAGSGGHFQARLGRRNFDFPINTVTVKAFDELGNKTEKTESFGFGKVRNILNPDGSLALTYAPRNPDNTLQPVPPSLAIFLSEPFISGAGQSDLKTALEKIMNSDEFKHDVFLKAFDPVQPMTSELSCPDTTQDFVKTFKLHPLTDDPNDKYPRIGTFTIRQLQPESGNRVWLSVHLSELQARADIFNMAFDDTDGDGKADLGGDIDSDGDGLCDDKDLTEGASGERCTAAVEEGVKVDDPYDNIRARQYSEILRGGHLLRDRSGNPIGDRCLGVGPLPIKIQLQGLTLNLEIELSKVNGRIKPKIRKITDRQGEDWPIVSFDGIEHRPIIFDCDRSRMLTPDENGAHQSINRRQCRALQDLDGGTINNSGLNTSCLNQLAYQQLKSTLENMIGCNLPNKLAQSMEKYQTNKLTQVSFNGLGKKFSFDLFSDLFSGDVRSIPTRGLGLSAKALVLPAGVSDENDNSVQSSQSFMAALADRLRDEGFGPLQNLGPIYQDFRPRTQGPIDALRDLGREVGVSLSEDAVNMILHSLNTALYDLDKKDPQFLDINTHKLRFDFEQPATEYDDQGNAVCTDKEGRVRNQAGFVLTDNQVVRSSPSCRQVTCSDDQSLDVGSCDCVDKAPCFPIALSVEDLLNRQSSFPDIDFNGDGVLDLKDGRTPVVLHLSLNPNVALTTKLVQSSDAHSSQGSPVAPTITGELEVGISNAVLSVFEGDSEGAKLSWCRQNEREQEREDLVTCQRSDHKKPIISFLLSGKLTFKVQLTTSPNGYGDYTLSMGLAYSSTESSLATDPQKSYLKLTVIEDTILKDQLVRSNNTLYTDTQLAQGIVGKVNSALSSLVFGGDSTIKVKMARRPVDKLRTDTAQERMESPNVPQSVLDDEEMIRNLEKFDIQDVDIGTPVFEVTPFAPRYLGIGLDLNFCYLSGGDLCE